MFSIGQCNNAGIICSTRESRFICSGRTGFMRHNCSGRQKSFNSFWSRRSFFHRFSQKICRLFFKEFAAIKFFEHLHHCKRSRPIIVLNLIVFVHRRFIRNDVKIFYTH